MEERSARTLAVHWADARADRKSCCTICTLLTRCRAPCQYRSYLTVLHWRGFFLSASASPCSNSTVRVRVLTTLDIRSTEARADLKECCTPRSPRVHVKRIACSNGPTLTTRKFEDGGYEWIVWMRDLIMPDPYFQSNDEYRGSV